MTEEDESVGLAGARDAQQHLQFIAPEDALAQLFYGLGLVALGREGGNDFEQCMLPFPFISLK